jgi:hypothetical protein
MPQRKLIIKDQNTKIQSKGQKWDVEVEARTINLGRLEHPLQSRPEQMLRITPV